MANQVRSVSAGTDASDRASLAVASPVVVDAEPAMGLHDEPDPDVRTTGFASWGLVVVALGVTVVGVVLRFVAPSPLWLDEALSVNIASLPVGEIPEALRQDGHPPAFYVLLHHWMEVFGSSDASARSLSGVWGLLFLPLMWVAGRRLGGPRVAWCALALAASSPYAIRYATEVRMYSMVAVLALAGWLLAGDALRRPTWWRLTGLALLAALGLWTHYWTLWLLGGAAMALLVRWWRLRGEGDTVAQRDTLKVLGSLVVGGLLFLPWVPTLLHQGEHTGTPWARPMRPTEILAHTVGSFGGGGVLPEAFLLGWLLVGLAVLGLLGRHVGSGSVLLEVRTQLAARPLAIIVTTTFALGCLAGYATGATYQPRYAAVVFGLFLLLVAMGVQTLALRTAGILVLAGICVLGVAVAVLHLREDRSDADRSAEVIEARAETDDLVVYCPDQLGPSTSRRLGDDLRQVTFPDLAPPQRVDWVDYQQRLDETSVDDFADRVVAEADGAAIFLVYSPTYSTHEELCPDLVDALAERRPLEMLAGLGEAFEPAAVIRFGTP